MGAVGRWWEGTQGQGPWEGLRAGRRRCQRGDRDASAQRWGSQTEPRAQGLSSCVTGGKLDLTGCIVHLTSHLLFSLLLLLPARLPSFLPPASSLLLFHSQENKDQLFHCLSCLCGSAGLRAGDALWCHRAGSRHLDLWGDVLPGPDISRRPAHNGVDFSPVLHFSGQVRPGQYSEQGSMLATAT